MTLVSMARSGLDYQFFQLLSEQIEKASESEKAGLADLREKLLEMTQEIDKAVQAQYESARKLLDKITSAADVGKATQENLAQISDVFVEVLDTELKLARQKGDLDRSGKLNSVLISFKKPRLHRQRWNSLTNWSRLSLTKTGRKF